MEKLEEYFGATMVRLYVRTLVAASALAGLGMIARFLF